MTLSFAVAVIALAALLAAFVWWRFLFFHRSPRRIIPAGDALLSPADGRVLYCECVNLDASTDRYHTRVRDALQIRGEFDVTAIYLSIFDVHLVRASIAGRVALHPIALVGNGNESMGRSMVYAALRRPLPLGRRSYAQKNELLGITLQDMAVPLSVHLVLMADWWIDQITVYVGEGQHVERGQILAKIHMGSQVDVWTPRGQYRLGCTAGDRVLAGSHALGMLSPNAPSIRSAT